MLEETTVVARRGRAAPGEAREAQERPGRAAPGLRRKPRGSSFRPLRRGAVALVAVVALAACGDGSGGGASPADPVLAGPYPVGVTRIELRDEARDRTLLTEVWYPADESVRGEPPAGPETYLPPELAPLAENVTVPLVAVRDAPLSPDAPFPLVAFSHGSGGVRYQNTFQMEHLASHGFVVVAPDHQGNTLFDSSEPISELQKDRPLDIEFVIDSFVDFAGRSDGPFAGWVDVAMPFGVTGHSFGAFTSLAVASMDERIAAALPMALGGPVSDTYRAATLLMLATEDHTIGLEGNENVRRTFARIPGPRFLAEIVDAGHFSFSIACRSGTGLGNGDGCGQGERLEDGSRFEYVDDMRVWRLIDAYSAALFGRYIEGIREYDDVLAGNLDPEILRYRAEPAGGPITTAPAAAPETLLRWKAP